MTILSRWESVTPEMGWGITGVALAYVGAYCVHIVTHFVVARKLL